LIGDKRFLYPLVRASCTTTRKRATRPHLQVLVIELQKKVNVEEKHGPEKPVAQMDINALLKMNGIHNI
jgi:hypothetical protein